MHEQTFIILKPDAIQRGLIGKIISCFERKGFKILRIEQHWKNKNWCRQHYPHICDEIYQNLVAFMTSAPIIGVILEGPDAIRVVRSMVGTTNSLEASPGTIRGDYGNTPVHYNLIHAADSKETFHYENDLFFDLTTNYNPIGCPITNNGGRESRMLAG